jgi:hypothetical protein
VLSWGEDRRVWTAARAKEPEFFAALADVPGREVSASPNPMPLDQVLAVDPSLERYAR